MLTEFYQTAINCHRIKDGDPIKKETLKKLQELAFHSNLCSSNVYYGREFKKCVR